MCVVIRGDVVVVVAVSDVVVGCCVFVARSVIMSFHFISFRVSRVSRHATKLEIIFHALCSLRGNGNNGNVHYDIRYKSGVLF